MQHFFPEVIADASQWRRFLHQHPELGYEVHETAAFVANKLREFGADEVIEGVGRTGVVARINGQQQSSGVVIGLRADMDALPIIEATGAEWASKTSGRMHACGHDGHTAMLLAAARVAAETRTFNGTLIVIFQPAEEGGAGGKAMVDDGLMERFGIQEVYGLHNMPALPIGEFAICPGPIMACADEFDIVVEGKGGHAAMPHACHDPVVVASHIVLALQSIVSRVVRPTDPLVVSVTTLNVESQAYNVIPQRVRMKGTVRAFEEDVRLMAKQRIKEIITHTAAAHNATAELKYYDGYPPTVNHEQQTAFVVDAARRVFGDGAVEANRSPVMGAEDFSYMLNKRPGAFIFMGNGDSAGLHHPEYDFNDDAIEIGCRYWMELIHQAMPASTP